jgi:hypothetical protein
MTKLIVSCCLVLMLGGCWNPFTEKPIREFYVYKTTDSKCYRVEEYKDRFQEFEVSCQKIPPRVFFPTINEWKELNDIGKNVE